MRKNGRRRGVCQHTGCVVGEGSLVFAIRNEPARTGRPGNVGSTLPRPADVAERGADTLIYRTFNRAQFGEQAGVSARFLTSAFDV